MNARTIRRAIERKAQKQARKAQLQAHPESEIMLASGPESLSLEQLQANRRNARLSTGPKTIEGKSISSRNALKTGLTGRSVLLPSEDAARYEHHVESFLAELNPVGDRETELAQSIADGKWRLARIPSLEFGIYALGRIQFAEEFASHSSAEAAALIEAKTFLAYQRQLNNLSIQEARLRRQCEKDTAELNRLQELRAAADSAPVLQQRPTPDSPTDRSATNGFEFSTSVHNTFAPDCEADWDVLSMPQAA